MKFWISMLAFLGFAAPAWAEAPSSVVFEHVTIIPMDRDRLIQDSSVMVVDGHIAAIGAALKPPARAKVIDGHGLYLMPGLSDMHVHAATSRDLAILLAHGVTTALSMGGASSDFVDQVVPAVNAGRRPGPHVYLSLRVDGTPEYGQLVIKTPEQARAVVGLAKTNGYDFIKVYNNLAPDVFAALADEGKKQGLPLVGHGVTQIGIEGQLARGQLMVAHLEEYLYTVFFPAGADVGTRAPRPEQIAAAVASTRRANAFVTADLATYGAIAHQWGKPDVVAGFLRDPEVRTLDPDMRIAWRSEGYASRAGSLDDRLTFLAVFAKALSDAGVPLVAGTDAPSIPGLFLGAALWADLHALEGAGLSRFQALSTATRTPGEMVARAKPGATCFGVVKVGCRADLLLLRGNPLDDLRALERPTGVMVGGVWREAAELSKLQADVAQRYEEALKTP